MNWEPTTGTGYTRTTSSSDLPTGTWLTSYEHRGWAFTMDLESAISSLSIDELEEIVQKLKQLNEKDTHNGRDTYSERAKEQVPDF